MLDRFMRGGEIVAHLRQELTRQTLFRIVSEAISRVPSCQVDTPPALNVGMARAYLSISGTYLGTIEPQTRGL